MQFSEHNNSSESLELEQLKRVEQELQARLRQQAAVARMGQAALTANDLPSFFDQVCAWTAETLAVDYSKILEILPGGDDLLLVSGAGWKDGLVGNRVVSGDANSQAGYTLRTKQPVIVEDLRLETRFSGPALLQDHGVISGMSVVIPGTAAPYGVLGVHTRVRHTFTEDDAHFLLSVANVLASAIVRFRAENVLRTSRDQLAVLLQGVSDGVIVQDASGKLVYANSTAARLLGFPSELALLSTSPEELSGRFLYKDEDGEAITKDRLPGSQVLLGLEPSEMSIRYVVKESGEERWAAVKATPVLNQDGSIELVVNIFRDITDLKRTELSRQLLSAASRSLTSSLDYEEILADVARLSVEHLSDWCVVYVTDEEQGLKTAAVAHRDPHRIELAREYQRLYPPDLDAPRGLGQVVRTGEPEFFPVITEELVADRAQNPQHYQMLKQLGLRSAMILPLSARGKTIGAISLIWAESGRRYSDFELAMAWELARLSAMAIDNGRLYRESQELNAGLEARVNRRTSQLQSIINRLRSEIAERKKAEKALRQSETTLNSLFESSPDATLLVDTKGRIVRVNTQAELLFGFERSELMGMSLKDLLPVRWQEDLQARRRLNSMLAMLKQPVEMGLELVGSRKDGAHFPLDVLLSPVEMAEGTRIICALRNISERKQMEAELAEVQRQLLESVEAERLHIAQELHDGPIQDLYGVTFHLNTLLSGIDPALNEDVVQAHELVKQVIGQLREMCSDLRPPSLAPFGLEKAIRAHLERLHETKPDLEVDVFLKPDEQLLPERIRLALFRIFQHAASNVVRHSGASRMSVRLDYDSSELVLEVADNGHGFELPRKWVELARRGHLGLVGTAERAQAIGARLEISSKPGRGTQIKVILPLEGENGQVYSRTWANVHTG